MKSLKIIYIILLTAITGCASSTSLQESADNHEKASEYYKSVGQDSAANEEKALAKEDNDDSFGIIAILVDLFNDKD
ncbi:MAG: hypothetical protein HRT53_21745 [Colwellia sp.]|nr:hypothetical protein [Colwellia sp.]